MVKGRKILIIEITEQEVRFLSWQSNWGKRPPQISFHIYPLKLPGRGDNSKFTVLQDVLCSYRSQLKRKGKIPAYLLIPLENGFYREFKLPWIKRRERDSALHYFLQHEVPLLADGLVYSYGVKEEKQPEYLTVRVTAAKKEVIASYANCLQRAGYVLQGVEYAANALGKFLELSGKKKILHLQEVEENRIQLVFYRDGYPEIIRELDIDQVELNKYHVYLGLNDLDLPVEYLSTDSSMLTEKVAELLQKAGFVQQRLNMPENLNGNWAQLVKEQGFKVYALLGEKLRITAKLNVDFYNIFRRRQKAKAIVAILGAFGLICGLTVILLWAPLAKDYLSLQAELALLQSKQEKLLSDEAQMAWKEWRNKQELSSSDLERIQKAIALMPSNLQLMRLNYKQRTLYLWAECSENADITQVIAALTAEGWREPYLTDYKYQNGRIAFAVSVQR
ncbi:MAG TPA: hypothetical protein GXX46_00960 [Peptococcaceae bacterium]|nr:hypothetical protein [Peptococcaceae bacterium]